MHAVIREVGASGGYWLACAADEIHANPMSIVGSIGVRGGGFGFPDMLARFGVERRLYTAGANKARLDPFSPEKPEDVAFVQELLDALHERFKAWVRTRRAGKLKGDEAALFDGSFMLGERALEVGLIDGFADIDSLVRRLGGERARTRVFRPRRRGLLRRLPGLMVDALFDAIEERSWRSQPRVIDRRQWEAAWHISQSRQRYSGPGPFHAMRDPVAGNSPESLFMAAAHQSVPQAPFQWKSPGLPMRALARSRTATVRPKP